MTTLFEAIRWLFFVVTVLLIIFLVTGYKAINASALESVHTIIMPAYLILVWLLIWYILNLVGRDGNETQAQSDKISTTAFIQGLIIGIFLALMYVFFI